MWNWGELVLKVTKINIVPSGAGILKFGNLNYMKLRLNIGFSLFFSNYHASRIDDSEDLVEKSEN